MDLIKNDARLDELLKKHRLPDYFRYFENYRPYFHLVKFQKNEYIYRKEFQRQYLIFLLNGKIKVCSHLSNGKSMLVCFYTTFQLLGDLEFCGINTDATSILAVEPCLCITLQITKIKKLLTKDDLFLMYLSRSLANKLAESSRSNSINLLYSLDSRLAGYICQACDGQMFSENLTQLAELLGTSYRHLLRVMKTFQDEELLTKTPEGYKINDKSRLQKLAQDLLLP